MHTNQNVSFSEEYAELVHRIKATEKNEGIKAHPPLEKLLKTNITNNKQRDPVSH